MGTSVTVLQLLQQSTTAEIVILADTSYGRSIVVHFVVSVRLCTIASAEQVYCLVPSTVFVLVHHQ